MGTLSGETGHPGASMSGTILPSSFLRITERRLVGASLVTALLVPEVNHSLSGVLGAVLSFTVSQTVRSYHVASLALAEHADYIDHSLLRVLRATQRLPRPGHTEDRTLYASFVTARPVPGIDHTLRSMGCAILSLLAAGNSSRWLLGASGIFALLKPEANHTIGSMLDTKFTVLATRNAHAWLFSTSGMATHLGLHVDHSFLDMLGAESRLPSARYTVRWNRRATRVDAF